MTFLCPFHSNVGPFLSVAAIVYYPRFVSFSSFVPAFDAPITGFFFFLFFFLYFSSSSFSFPFNFFPILFLKSLKQAGDIPDAGYL